MKPMMLLSLVLMLLAGQAMGFGILAEGEGSLALDPDKLHTASSFDFDRDGLPDLVLRLDSTFQVRSLDGSTLWSATIDTLALCPECTGPDGWWNFSFEGFFMVEPGHNDAVIFYYYDNYGMNIYSRGVLVVSTADGTIRHQFEDRYLVVAVDLDGDDLQELMFGAYQPATWEVWGHNGLSGVPQETGQRLRLNQNYPNPFNPQTTVRFELTKAGPARVEVHDLAGHLVYQRPLGELPEGPHEFTWRGVDRRGTRLASGTYILTVVSGTQRHARKMMLMK